MRVVYFAPRGFDYLSSQLIEGLHLLSKAGELGFYCTNRSTHHGAQVDDLSTVTEEAAKHYCEGADWILFSTAGDFEFYDGIPGSVFSDDRYWKKLVFIDGHDGNDYLCDPNTVGVYLKRELRYPEFCPLQYSNVRSLTFGIYQFWVDMIRCRQDDWDKRDVDITFIAYGGSSDLRGQAQYVLKQLHGQKLPSGRPLNVVTNVDSGCQPLSIEEYRAALARTKIGISIVGAGVDTLRFWETMGAGAVLCSNDITRMMYIRDMPEPHRHALYFDSWNRMLEMCVPVVSNKWQWLRMRNATDKLIWSRHTTINRARQLLSICEELV